MSRIGLSRRAFLATAGVSIAGSRLAMASPTDERPPVANPRSTSGDRRHEPDWKERLTITVGPNKADLVGNTEKVIQAAVDYVVRFGGGTVKILPGEYRLRNSVFLSSGVRLLGTGDDAVLIKNASHSTTLVEDSDWYDQEITLAEGHGFEIGDAVCLQTKNPHDSGSEVLKRTLVARNGNRFKLDKPLRFNHWLVGKPTASSLFPLITGEYIENIHIEDLTLDGNRKENENFNGNYGGCLFFQDCNDLTFRGLTTRNYNGDGISWQICHDVVVENCHSHDNADLGLHPGSGSQRPLIRNNRLERNNIGIFFCWGVKYGLAEGNKIVDTRGVGVSIGHNDTDNLVRNNDIIGSGQVGVLFRDESRGKDFWPNRNRIENNRIIDSGPEGGVAVDVQGKTRDITLHKNEIREKRQPMQRTGVRIGAETRDIRLEENVIEGFAVNVVDNRK